MSRYEYEKCPYCHGRRLVEIWREPHPYGDSVAYETMCEVGPCEDCGFGSIGLEEPDETPDM